MKTGEAAKLLGVDPNTVRSWINHPLLSRYFSENAAGKTGEMQRSLLEADILVLNTVRMARIKNIDWPEIAQLLESGHRDQQFPQNAISPDPRLIPIPQAKQAAELLEMQSQRDQAISQIKKLEDEITELRNHRLEDQRRIGYLEAQVEMLRDLFKGKG